LGSINGTVVGIAASSHLNNKLTIKDLSKITKFIKVCNCFNISFISLINCEGFLENLEQEKDGILLEATKTLAAICQASIPKVALIYGTCYGAIYTILAGKGITFDIVYAWPNSQICITNPEKLIKILYKEDILSSELPIEKERQILKSSINDVTSPYRAAEEGYIDDIILPEEMRQRIFSAIDMLQSKREIKYPKKHNSSLI
ncbi:carboxyl transferase, partial [Clostridium tetanomorphum DSM 665]